jgi:hypothetical protein
MEDRLLATTSYRASKRRIVRAGVPTNRSVHDRRHGTVEEIERVRREQRDERTGQPSYGLILDQHFPWISNPDRSRGCWRHC